MSIYQQFGLRQIINASGKMTALGASVVHESVADALRLASQDYVDITELMSKAGEIIAECTGAEDGCPTSGAAAGIAIATAGVITGLNLQLIEQIPNAVGVPNEIVIQKGHVVHFGASIAQMVVVGGGKVVEVGQSNHVEQEHIEQAINENTAALLYVKSHHAVQKGMQSLETMLSLAKKHGIPLILDAAAEEEMRKYIGMGVDLVIYSGGKALEGPTSGFICGRKQLIDACRAQYKGVGRAMKVGKESIIGLLTALSRYQNRENNAIDQRKRMEWLINQLQNTVIGIDGRIVQDEAGREIFRAQLTVHAEEAGMTAQSLIEHLEKGNPAIFTRNHFANVGVIYIDPRPLLPGQEQTIAERIKEILGGVRR